MTSAEILARVDRKKMEIDQARPLGPTALGSLKADFTVRYAHETTAIEGNTLSLAETQVVLEDGVTIAGKSVREHLEVLNMRDALNWLERVVQDDASVTEHTVYEMHRIIMSGILKEEAGFLRREPVYIVGSAHVPPNWVKLPDLMTDFSEWLSRGPAESHPVVFATRAHFELAQIHPFVDGNGRTARLLTNLLLMRHGYPPALYEAAQRAEYIQAIRLADDGDLGPFVACTARAVEVMADRYLTLITMAREARAADDGSMARRSQPNLDKDSDR